MNSNYPAPHLHGPLEPSQDYVYDEDAPPPVPMRRKHPFTLWWEKVGGGSLTVSIIVHAIFLLIAFIYIVSVITEEKKVDFIPGGSAAGKDASSDLATKVSSKRKSAMKPTVPLQKIVTSNVNASITLPDSVPDLVDTPEMPSMSGGGFGTGAGGGGGGGGAGGTDGFGGFGTGPGSNGGFVATMFGRIGGEGLPGTLYDLKQKPNRQPTGFDKSVPSYADVIQRADKSNFRKGGVLNDYFSSTQKMTFTFLAVPNATADLGPKAFRVENEVEPTSWLVHYTGNIAAPTPGEWRFVGIFDDALVVYINNRPVLDGSWDNYVNQGVKNPVEGIREEMTNSVKIFPAKRQLYIGKWVRMTNTMKIDILVGERPGGLVGGVLLVEKKGEKYEMRPDGTPILPVFTTTELDGAAVKRLYDFSQGEPTLQFARDTPVFEVKKDLFN